MAETVQPISIGSDFRRRRDELTRTPAAVRAVVLGVVISVLMSACSGGDTAESELGECEGRAEFWRTIQQEYLDRLGDAPAGELDPPSARVSDAGEWLGTAMVEFNREADSVGCGAEVRAGSPFICAAVEQLEPHGGAGEFIVDQHAGSCPK